MAGLLVSGDRCIRWWVAFDGMLIWMVQELVTMRRGEVPPAEWFGFPAPEIL
jgi:hypothetical protein